MTMFPCGKIDGRMSSTVIVHDSRIGPVYADMRIAAYPYRRHIIRWCNIEFTRVDSPVDFVRQHVIDPELCSRCGACADACTQSAVCHDSINYVVDAQRCKECRDCLRACSTGAINSWRVLARSEIYSVEEQFSWESLPEQSPPPAGLVFDDLPIAGGNGHGHLNASPAPQEHTVNAPASAAVPSVNVYTLLAAATATIVVNQRAAAAGAEADLRHIVLDFGTADFPFLEGQNLSILPPGRNSHGHPNHARVYSVASSRDGENGRRGHIAVTVKRVVEDYDGTPVRGVCSNYLCDLAPGARVKAIGPSGSTFLMPEERDARLLMICTGTGIAPMRSMIERRKRTEACDPGTLMLYYGGRRSGEMAYLDEFEALPSGWLDLNVAYSRDPAQPRRHVQDLLDSRAADIARWILEQNCYVYVCGLRAMEAGVVGAFRRALACRNADWDVLMPQLKRAGRYHVEVY